MITKSQLQSLIMKEVRELLVEQEQLTLPHVEKSGPRRIVSYFETWTPEDIDHGEASDRGELDDVEIELDEWDREEETTIVDKAVEYLKGVYASEPSSSSFHPGVWYTSYGESDYRTGEVQNESYHLKDFTEEEEKAIFDEMTS